MTFAVKAMALAAFAQTLLTSFALMRLSSARRALLTSGAVDRARAAIDKSVWPDDVKKLDNSLNNQFETPILFFAAIAMAFGLGLADAALAALSWLFVVGRVAHMAVHTGSNDMSRRGIGFGLSFLALLIMWVWLAGRVILA